MRRANARAALQSGHERTRGAKRFQVRCCTSTGDFAKSASAHTTTTAVSFVLT